MIPGTRDLFTCGSLRALLSDHTLDARGSLVSLWAWRTRLAIRTRLARRTVVTVLAVPTRSSGNTPRTLRTNNARHSGDLLLQPHLLGLNAADDLLSLSLDPSAKLRHARSDPVAASLGAVERTLKLLLILLLLLHGLLLLGQLIITLVLEGLIVGSILAPRKLHHHATRGRLAATGGSIHLPAHDVARELLEMGLSELLLKHLLSSLSIVDLLEG
mmetsp:Transcript_4836/g.7758  ORF Transcript_4836/g.7758 Transcript_4836/m.7758 type:complete len:216 (+) Transcript_4836:553-1200(+)